MSIEWGSLPHLPLRCVLEHLSMEDALAATSTCRHWRTAILMYEGHKEKLKLRVKHFEKNMFVTRMFKKYTRSLHVYIDNIGEEMESFMSYVLPQFFDTLKLNELVFVGPTYMQQNKTGPIAKLNRIITESLIYKHIHNLRRLTLIGCEMVTPKNDNERYTHKLVEYHSRALSFNSVPCAADTVLSSTNASLMVLSSLKHITIEYEYLNKYALRTLAKLPQLTHITLTISRKRSLTLPRLDWLDWPSHNFSIGVNIISVPTRGFKEIMENVLVEGLTLTSLKVMFCKTLFAPLIAHVVNNYSTTLQELVWVDAPYDSCQIYHRIVKPARNSEYERCTVNPLILLCWQCEHLRRLVVHGYWLWQYDVNGFARLRKTLEEMEVSAIFNRRTQFTAIDTADTIFRVLASDSVAPLDEQYVTQINEHTEFKWKPCEWRELHPALRELATTEQRTDYIIAETTRPPRMF